MDVDNLIIQHAETNILTTQQILNQLIPSIAKTSQVITKHLLEGKKILSCGNGGSANIAQHFTSIMLNNLEMERPAFPSICLSNDINSITAVANADGFKNVYAKQIRALGNAEDILLAISTTGNSRNILNAIEAAHNRDMLIILLSGRDGGAMAALLRPEDIEIRIPSEHSLRIQEAHMLMVHCLCDLIDKQLFGG